MRRIDADALKSVIQGRLNALYSNRNVGTYDEIADTIGKIYAFEIVIRDIESFSSIDDSTDHVAKWVPLNEMPFCVCSNCGSMFDSTICRNIFVLYCPRCGRRIKAVTDDD